jgi:hypothetical protein
MYIYCQINSKNGTYNNIINDLSLIGCKERHVPTFGRGIHHRPFDIERLISQVCIPPYINLCIAYEHIV